MTKTPSFRELAEEVEADVRAWPQWMRGRRLNEALAVLDAGRNTNGASKLQDQAEGQMNTSKTGPLPPGWKVAKGHRKQRAR